MSILYAKIEVNIHGLDTTKKQLDLALFHLRHVIADALSKDSTLNWRNDSEDDLEVEITETAGF